MHDLILILKRFIPPYKLRVTKSIIFNFLHAIFGSLSIAMLGPILKIIFNNEQDVTELVPFEFNSESIGQIFNYYITTIKYTSGMESSGTSVVKSMPKYYPYLFPSFPKSAKEILSPV